MAADFAPIVLEWFKNHPDKMIRTAEVQKGCGCKNPSSVIKRLMDRGEAIERVGQGVYIYHSKAARPNAPVVRGMMLEVIGVQRDGTPIAEDENGGLWKLGFRAGL